MSAGDQQLPLSRIYPPGVDAPSISARAAYAELDLTGSPPETRPYTVVNMVATVDGQGRIGENTAELGGAADAALFATLRERVDCVMAGTGTIAAEQYNAPARSEEVRARRERSGFAARPLMATLTRSGKLPLEAPLFSDPGITVVAFGGDAGLAERAAADVRCPPETDPAAAARILREDFGVRALLLEGGPTLNGPFFAAELVDELFLTIAPTLIGGEGAFPIIAGELPSAQRLHLIGALSGEEHLFLRYRVD